MSRETIDLYTRCVEAMTEMQHRGLHNSASWLGEMIIAASPSLQSSTFDYMRPTLQETDTAAIKLGESYLQNQEFRRCTALLTNEPGFRASFLGLYALYLDGEKQKDVAGAADYATHDRISLGAAVAVGAASTGGGGGGHFAVDSQGGAGGGIGSIGGVGGGFSGAVGSGSGINIHADIPGSQRRNHHALDLDRALSTVVSFQQQQQNTNTNNTSSSNNAMNNTTTTSSSENTNANNNNENISPELLQRGSGSGNSLKSNNNNNNNNNNTNNNVNINNNSNVDNVDAASPPVQREHCIDHAYLHWLHGVVRRERGFRDEAATSFRLAVTLEPLLWCAWVDLASVINNNSENDIHQILQHVFHPNRPRGFNQSLSWIGQCFSALAKSEMQILQPAIAEYEQLLSLNNNNDNNINNNNKEEESSTSTATATSGNNNNDNNSSSRGSSYGFPSSAYLQSRLGQARYHRKELASSREAFEAAISNDPLRLEGIDHFSNLLFVMGDKPRLAALAQTCYSIDPFRAETHCVAGNYFAMLRRHAQSVQHFRRAVTIDRKNSSAWTLLGHGYVEIKNTKEAVEAYNQAVEVDRRDYRAWYGLGQIFELLCLYPQALEFYRQAAAVRPHDSRMWSVVAGCLEKQNRVAEAMKCYERAEACEPSSTDFYCNLVRRLADYHASLRPGFGDSVQKAASYFGKLLQSAHSSTEDRVSSLLFLCATRVFESFDLLEIAPRDHSSIYSLQQRQHPLDPSRWVQNNNNNNNKNDSNNAANNDSNSAAIPNVSPVPRMLSLPQPAASFHFGRAQPKLPGVEMKKGRASSLVSEADAMLNHLRQELLGSNNNGDNSNSGGHQQLQIWLQAYQHDLDCLRQYF